MKYHIDSVSWKAIYSFLCQQKGIHTRDECELRVFVEAIWFVVRSGCQWRLLPDYYGNWRAVHRRFKRWAEAGVWEELMRHVSTPDTQEVMIDAKIVRSHACASGYGKNSQDREALGRSKGGFTTKIHAVVDALGQALRFSLTPGQRHDITQASSLIQGFEGANVIADKGYDSNELVEQIQNQNCTPIIPPRSNQKTLREYDQHLYKERHLVECFFNKIKHFRRVF